MAWHLRSLTDVEVLDHLRLNGSFDASPHRIRDVDGLRLLDKLLDDLDVQ